MKNNFLFFFLLALAACNEKSSGQSGTVQKGYKDWYIGNFRCGVYIPPSYDPVKKYPLIINLHGKSDTVTRVLKGYNDPAVLADPCIVISPKCPLSETGDWGNSWTPGDPPMIKKTFEIIELLKKQYNLDEDRFYIYGTSMGAIGTFGLIQRYPHMFAAGWAVCGWGDPKIAPQLAGIPFLIFHGEKDDVVPVQGSRGVYNAVLKYGGKQIRYTEFKGVKHDAWNYVDESKIYPWLLKQRKGLAVNSAPGKVNGVSAKVNGSNIQLQWQNAGDNLKADDQAWYYKIYRNKDAIAEVDGNQLTYIDSLPNKNATHAYRVSVVNYHFKESELSAPVNISLQPRSDVPSDRKQVGSGSR